MLKIAKTLRVRFKSDKIAKDSRIAKNVKPNPDSVLQPYQEPVKPYKKFSKKEQVGLDKSFEDYYEIKDYDEDGYVNEREVMKFAKFNVSVIRRRHRDTSYYNG